MTLPRKKPLTSGLKRGQGLPRSSTGLPQSSNKMQTTQPISQKTALKEQSKLQSRRLKKYFQIADQDPYEQTCAVCEIEGTRDTLDRHHPSGRVGGNLYNYIYCCRYCHMYIHEHPIWAKEKGYLT